MVDLKDPKVARVANKLCAFGLISVFFGLPLSLNSAQAAAKPVASQMGRCINMANHLEAPKEGEWGRPIADSDFTNIKAAGFSTIRLPVRFSSYADQAPPYLLEPAFMTRLDHVLAQAQAANLNIILDLHHYDELNENPLKERDRFVAIWAQIAERYKDLPDSVWFELANEPHKNFDHSNLLSVLEPALAEVRKTNPTRKVVIGGEQYSNIRTLADLPLPNDPNIVATFHYYDPFAFTHQGASWTGMDLPTNRVFGSPADLAELKHNIGLIKAFQTKRQVPVFMGEYGAYESIPVAQRALYYKAVTEAFEGAGVPGCIWGYTNTFPLYKDGRWIPEIMQALGMANAPK
jgi:endoglucanase